MKKIKLEICCFSLQDAIQAEKGGADQIELCANYPEGGVTPSIGLIQSAAKFLSIPITLLIRPRSGDFFYDNKDWEVIMADIEYSLSVGIKQFSIGALSKKGELDVSNLLKIKSYFSEANWIFNKAFDLVTKPLDAIDTLSEIGFTGIMTSGSFGKNCIDCLEQLNLYSKAANSKIQIIAAGGIRLPHIPQIVNQSGCSIIHTAMIQPGVYEDGFLNKNAVTSDLVKKYTETLAAAQIV